MRCSFVNAERDLPPLTKVAQAWNDVRFVVQALIDPTRDLRTTLISIPHGCRREGRHTTLRDGYRVQNVVKPSGEAIYVMRFRSLKLELVGKGKLKKTNQIDKNDTFFRNPVFNEHFDGFHS